MGRAARLFIIIGIVIVAGMTVAARYLSNGNDGPAFATAAVTRGTIAETVSATGTLEAVTTVEVGTQVSGTVKELLADYNDIVRKGQIVARLEPSLFETQVAQAEANVARAAADLERLAVGREDARVKLERARQLSERQLIAATELQAAEVELRSADAQLASARAAVKQARATLNQSQVNLGHTIIRSPIDGIVISRNVDVGQTVAASMQAPTLYVLAADLTQMQVNASIDEADVGRVREGQPVRFRVDAFPEREFEGAVKQVRLQPTTEQNVVTYTTVISAANPEMLLKPGMTASVTIELARHEDVLQVPAAALRFKPSAETFAALDQEPVSLPAKRASVWVLEGGHLTPVAVETVLSNGTLTEVRPAAGMRLTEETEVVTAVATDAAAAAAVTAASETRNPFVPQPPRPSRATGGASRSTTR